VTIGLYYESEILLVGICGSVRENDVFYDYMRTPKAGIVYEEDK
jgi:hypothetical protein